MAPTALAEKTREALRLQRAGRLPEARTRYEAILAEAPRYAPACNGLALIELAAGRPANAWRLLEIAIAERPDSAIYRNNGGNALKAMGRLDEAAGAYHEALRLDPGYANARYNLGLLEVARGARPAAVAHLRALVAAHPDFALGWVELGTLLRELGRIDEAIPCHERAIALLPDRSASYNDLGALYLLQGRSEAALACFERALALDPRSGHAWFNQGKLLADLNRFDEACRALERAMALEPGLATEAACHLAVVRRHLCDWSEEVERTADLVARIEAMLRDAPTRGLPPLTLNVVSIPAALRLAVARHLGRGVEREVGPAGRPSRAGRSDARVASRPVGSKERLRIGYVSPDFRVHAVGSLIHALFAHHDRSAVEVSAYSLVTVDDPFARAIRAGVDRFVDVGRGTPAQIAERIRRDQIDVLVDLAGYTTFSKTAIFALRPAPVQIHWLGYLDTMGADFLPYLLADDTVVPEEATADYSETIVTLPRGFAVASPLPIGETPTRGALGLPEEAFVFCCLNGLHKLDAEVFDAWMRILDRVPGSILWLADEGAAAARANLAVEAKRRGVDPSRLHFAPRAPLAAYLAYYRVADLFLDTFAYNAGATAAGALRAGLPVLTRPGRSFMSRMGASLCRSAGLPEMVCMETEAYEARAVELARDPVGLAGLRARLAAGQDATGAPAPLFDLPGFARQLEAAYRAIGRHRAEGSTARRIAVE